MSQPMGDRTECWGQGRGTRSPGAPRHGVSGMGCCWGQRWETWGHPRRATAPWGTGWDGVLRTWGCWVGTAPAAGPRDRSSPETCVSGGRRKIVPHPARCSSPCLARAGPQPVRDLPHPPDPMVPVSPAHPTLPTGRGGPAGPGDTAVGTRPLTLQLVADAVGHFLDVRRQLLQVIFGLCGITAREPGKPPRECPQECPREGDA